jgi:hypothetical protein
MSSRSRVPLADRVTRAAEAALAAQGFTAPVDVLLGIGWLDPNTERRWRQGQIDALQDAMQVDPSRLAEAMQLFLAWASSRKLLADEAVYLARTPQRPPLRFSRSGDPAVESRYRTHWISPQLPARQQEKLKAKASKPPELVVIQPLNRDWVCHRCGDGGDLLIMEPPGPACLRCAGLDDLSFLPAGDATLTRRAKASSARAAVVVRFSKSRGRYERQGLLVEQQALVAARPQDKS